jgi:AbrB family looped-hinge helix DNA binding protein
MISDMPSKVFTAEVIAGGRVTIPKKLRDLLGISSGKLVKLQILEVYNSLPISEEARGQEAAADVQ